MRLLNLTELGEKINPEYKKKDTLVSQLGKHVEGYLKDAETDYYRYNVREVGKHVSSLGGEEVVRGAVAREVIKQLADVYMINKEDRFQTNSAGLGNMVQTILVGRTEEYTAYDDEHKQVWLTAIVDNLSYNLLAHEEGVRDIFEGRTDKKTVDFLSSVITNKVNYVETYRGDDLDMLEVEIPKNTYSNRSVTFVDPLYFQLILWKDTVKELRGEPGDEQDKPLEDFYFTEMNMESYVACEIGQIQPLYIIL